MQTDPQRSMTEVWVQDRISGILDAAFGRSKTYNDMELHDENVH